MRKQVIFVQGGGDGGYEADAMLVASLQEASGKDYEISHPRMQTEDAAPDFGWLKQIGEEIGKLRDNVILVAHSLGASLLLKYLSENKISKKVAGIFLVATPFWSGKEEWVQGLKLQKDFAENLPKNSRIFFYHCRDDEEIPFDHLASYRFRAMSTACHFVWQLHGCRQTDNFFCLFYVKLYIILLVKSFLTMIAFL